VTEALDEPFGVVACFMRTLKEHCLYLGPTPKYPGLCKTGRVAENHASNVHPRRPLTPYPPDTGWD